MQFHALCCDYDGTLAHHGALDEPTLAALLEIKASGRRLVLVSGREKDDLFTVLHRPEVFDLMVLENGALLYRPQTREEELLAEPPPAVFVETLKQRGVGPISVGRCIVATWTPHEETCLAAIRDLGLELQVIFNKGAVMILPTGVNKATGLVRALRELGLSPHNAVSVGDAENDHAMLTLAGCGVAVANALPALKQHADWITPSDHGTGVRELIDHILKTDLDGVAAQVGRHDLQLGEREDGRPFRLRPQRCHVLLSGASGSGKSTFASAYVEKLVEARYQFCIVDPEGDYEHLEGAVVLGDPARPPTVKEVVEVLSDPRRSCSVNLVGLPLTGRPAFFDELLPRLLGMRSEVGRPHAIVVDEAHHLLPAAWAKGEIMKQAAGGIMLITVHPERVAADVLAAVDTVVAVGEDPGHVLQAFAQRVVAQAPPVPAGPQPKGQVTVWARHGEAGAFRVRAHLPRAEHKRHVRKYAEGELPPERSFYFEGPQGALHLRAQNLGLFLQIGDGVDDGTWEHHLRRGDYSRWLRENIKDPELAAAVAAVEEDQGLDARASRARVREVIEQRYTAPA